VRTQRAGDAAHARATAVASRRVFQVEHDEVLDSAPAQRTRRRQARDAGAGNDDLGAPHRLRDGPGARIAQQMAAFERGAHESAFDVRQRIAARQRGRACSQQAAAFQP
jgi:hypothetical protein